MKAKAVAFEDISKIVKPLARMVMNKREDKHYQSQE